jgi:hypothetical protein
VIEIEIEPVGIEIEEADAADRGGAPPRSAGPVPHKRFEVLRQGRRAI